VAVDLPARRSWALEPAGPLITGEFLRPAIQRKQLGPQRRVGVQGGFLRRMYGKLPWVTDNPSPLNGGDYDLTVF